MMNPKKKRGRPIGSGKDDSALLNRVADLILDGGTSSPWSAIYRVVASAIPDAELKPLNVKRESIVRRLLRKWQRDSRTLIESAQLRRTAKAKKPTVVEEVGQRGVPLYAQLAAQASAFHPGIWAQKNSALNGLMESVGRNPMLEVNLAMASLPGLFLKSKLPAIAERSAWPLVDLKIPEALSGSAFSLLKHVDFDSPKWGRFTPLLYR